MSERTLQLRVRERNRRATRFVFEDGVPTDYAGGEVATLPIAEACRLLASGNFDAIEPMTDDEAMFVQALMDRNWAARNGRFDGPQPSDFNLQGST